MDTIAYGDLRIEMLAEYGGKIERGAQQVMPKIGLNPRTPAPGELNVLLGRDAEIAAANAATAGEPIEFYAGCGFGKSALLRRVAAQLRARTAAPVVYMRVGRHLADDLWPRLVETLYTADRPFVPTPEQRAQLLAQARATILLDDVTLGPGEVGEILGNLPQCAVVLGCDRPVLGGRGRSIPLMGLPTQAALDLLRSDLGRDLTNRERADAERLCDVVDGQPWHLRQAAALVREGRHRFADLAYAAERNSFALDRLSVAALAEGQRRALALLAFAAGALVPVGMVANLADLHDTRAILTSLRDCGLVVQDEGRFGLPACHAGDYRALLRRDLELTDAVRVLVSWVRLQAPGSHDAEAAIGAALSIIGYAAERADWPAVVRLAEAIEPVLAMSGRWEAWSDILARGLAAARLVGDLAAQARMSHQLGVHQFAMNHPDQAREYWEEALRLREEVNDAAGAAVTRFNLRQLPPVASAPGPAHRRPSPRRLVSKGARAWAIVAGATAVAVAIPLAHAITGGGSSDRAVTAGPTGPQATSEPTGTDSVTPGSSGGRGNNPRGGGKYPGGGGNIPVGGGNPVGGRAYNPGGVGNMGLGTPFRPGATVLVSPPGYRGPRCPAVFRFTGVIHASSGPVAVTYRWIRSDGTTGPEKRIAFTGRGPQEQTVTDAWSLSANGTNWEAIQILSPGSAQSNDATFTLNCQKVPSVTATAAVSPPSYSGTCPGVFRFTGVIHVSSGPVAVTYRWIRSDGTTGPEKRIAFTGRGPQEQTVTDAWSLSAIGTLWEAIQILSPGSAQSNEATFTIDCQVTWQIWR